jgi:SAM-dependent methyltransferase
MRFKGLDEISPKEFSQFIGKEMKLSQVEYAPSTMRPPPTARLPAHHPPNPVLGGGDNAAMLGHAVVCSESPACQSFHLGPDTGPAGRRHTTAMSFDTLAPCYRSMEWLTAGGGLQRCRTAFLAETKTCRHALLLGEGPGRFLVELRRARPQLEIQCVERSPRMIAEAVQALRREGLGTDRVQFECRDILAWSGTPGTFDLIATHFFFDCFRPEELAQLIPKIAACATADARWLLTDFHLPPRGWQRWRARAALCLMYAFFRATTHLSATKLTPADAFLGAAGFRLRERRLASAGLVKADLWERPSPRLEDASGK